MEEKSNSVKVEVIDSGPLKITGKIVFRDLKRNQEETTDEILLCRCGRTGNRPFCDGSQECRDYYHEYMEKRKR